MNNIAKVISWKFSAQEGMDCSEDSNGNIVITAFPNGIPTQAEQDLWTTDYNTFVAANEYKGLRKAKYDALSQFEMQYDDAKNSTTTWVDAINAIKQEYPK